MSLVTMCVFSHIFYNFLIYFFQQLFRSQQQQQSGTTQQIQVLQQQQYLQQQAATQQLAFNTAPYVINGPEPYILAGELSWI